MTRVYKLSRFGAGLAGPGQVPPHAVMQRTHREHSELCQPLTPHGSILSRNVCRENVNMQFVK